MTQIFLNTFKISDGLYGVDIMGENLPENFFGVAFHLMGDGQWSLEKAQVAESLGVPQEDVLFIATEKIRDNSQHEIVVGLSLKHGTDVILQDGRLMSFVVQAHDEPEFSFHQALLSVLTDQGRSDLSDVVWGTSAGVENVMKKPSPGLPYDGKKNETFEIFSSEVPDDKIDEAQFSGNIVPPGIIDLYWFLGWILLLLVVVTVLVFTFLKPLFFKLQKHEAGSLSGENGIREES